MVAPHDVTSAVEETRRCVEKYGFKGIFLLPGQVGASGTTPTTTPCGPSVSGWTYPWASTVVDGIT